MASDAFRRPADSEYHEYYAGYVGCVPTGDVIAQLDSQVDDFRTTLNAIDDAGAEVVHQPYAWTIKQVVGHMIDAEKLFGWRAHRFACGDKAPSPGMDQQPYVDALDYSGVSLAELTDELTACRQANLSFVRRVPPAAWDNVGKADGHEVTVRALVYILVGHIQHHLEIIKQRVQEVR